MRVIVNQAEFDLPSQSVITDALSAIQAQPPYAVAVNLQFVPKHQHDQYELHENDQIEIIAPVTGG